MKTIFLTWLPFILRMSRPGKKITRKHLFMSSKMKELELKERSSRSLLANVLDMDDDFRGQHPNNSAPVHTVSGGGRGGGSAGDETPLYHPCLSTQRELQSILRELRFITRRMREDDENQEVISDWKFAGMVVDRICLFGFTLFTILSTCVTIFQAPHLVAWFFQKWRFFRVSDYRRRTKIYTYFQVYMHHTPWWALPIEGGQFDNLFFRNKGKLWSDRPSNVSLVSNASFRSIITIYGALTGWKHQRDSPEPTKVIQILEYITISLWNTYQGDFLDIYCSKNNNIYYGS